MAFYDWNHNGKKDMQDDYLEYKIYQESTKGGNQPSAGGSGMDGCSCLLFLVLGILFVINLIARFTS